MSTLPPTPSYNPDIPIVSSAGGTSAAYKDPNSPESIMKKTTLVKAQGAVDTSYDVDVKKETTEAFRSRRRFSNNKYTLLFFVFAIFYILVSRTKSLKPYAKIFLAVLALTLLAITVSLYQNGSPGT